MHQEHHGLLGCCPAQPPLLEQGEELPTGAAVLRELELVDTALLRQPPQDNLALLLVGFDQGA